jgi:hypothetical protein
VAVLNEMWTNIQKGITEAAAKIIGKKKDHREIVGLMKNLV